MVVLQPVNGAISSQNTKLVCFRDVPLIFSLDDVITVEFEFISPVKGSTRDWIGLFEENWNSLESFVAYEWGIGRSSIGKRRKIKFHPKYFRDKISVHLRYQFIYVSRHLEVLGMSSYFVFDEPINMHENMLSCCTSPTSGETKISEQSNTHVRCRIQKLPFISNLITTCNLCRPLVSEQVSPEINFNAEKEELKIKMENIDKQMESLECIVDALITRIVYNEEVIDKRFSELMRASTPSFDNFQVGDNLELHEPSLDEVIQSKEFSTFDDQFCFLKAIIGHQEEKIRALTKNMHQPGEKNCEAASTNTNQDTVKLVKTEERMLAQLMRVTADCEEYTNDDDFNQPDGVNKVVKTINLFEKSTAL